MSSLLDTLVLVVKAFWGLKEGALRLLVILLLAVLGWTFWHILPRLQVLEMEQVRTQEQRHAEIKAIEDLTTEIKEYRKAVVGSRLSITPGP